MMRGENKPYALLFFSLVSLCFQDALAQQQTNPPVADSGGPYVGDESRASAGVWTIDFDATGSSDDFGITLYEWDWDYDGSFNPSPITGPTPSYGFDAPGDYQIALRVTDTDVPFPQTSIDLTVVSVFPEAPPVADAGPDVSLDESAATGGAWTINFDGSNSTDDFGIYLYEWDWNYDGTLFNPSGDTGALASYSWDSAGNYTVALQVTDNALQAHIDTVSVTLTGDPTLIPVPGALWLFGSGLLALGGLRRDRR